MHYLDSDQIITLKAVADVTSEEESFRGMRPPDRAAYCIDLRECLTTKIKLHYDRATYGMFPWDDVQSFLCMETTPVDDLTVRSLTVKIDSQQLRNQIRNVLTDMGLTDTNYLKCPFFFTLQSRPAKRRERDKVKKHNDDDFLSRVGYRVLELQQMYSLRAQQDKKDILLRGKSDNLYPRGLEDMAFNYNDPAEQQFGALYSNLIINKWRAAFSRNLGEKTPMVWTDDGQWKRVDERDDASVVEEPTV
jgi:hypothetical protein